jgi:hypothetical protein
MRLAMQRRESRRSRVVASRVVTRRHASEVDAQPVGESHFENTSPMTVERGSSAMVSMVRSPTDGEVVYLYDAESERGNARFAFRAVRFKNPTDSTLETGPVTVYGNERFIGEGLTEPIPPRDVDRRATGVRARRRRSPVRGPAAAQRGQGGRDAIGGKPAVSSAAKPKSIAGSPASK